ncbi:MAG: MBL fold metallo-hydrolase, partial [Bacillota bacterium]|nr:MBL fold metallo-hydrolase [Bacillota bacterium]
IIDSPDGTSPFVNMYLVEGSEKAVLIDAGLSRDDLAGYVKTLTNKPIEVIITHGHVDHIMCADQFDKVYMSHSDVSVVNSGPGLKHLDTSKFIDLQGGEVFDLGGYKLEIIAFPGHTYGSIVILDRERQYLFASDSIGSGELWMQLDHSTSMEEYVIEIKRFEKQIEGLNQLKVLLGHDCLMEQKPDIQYIIDTRITAENIVSGEMKGAEIDGDKPQYLGAYSAKYGQINIIYAPDNIFIKK